MKKLNVEIALMISKSLFFLGKFKDYLDVPSKRAMKKKLEAEAAAAEIAAKAEAEAKAKAQAEEKAKARAIAKAAAKARAEARAAAKAKADAKVAARIHAAAKDSGTAAKFFFTCARKRDHSGFDKLEKELLARSAERWTPLIQAHRALLQLEDVASEAKLEEQFRPGIYWMRGPFPGNFGDILTPYVMWRGFGVVPRWTAPRHAQGICIGSIAKFAQPGMHVWGSGMPRDDNELCATAIYAAVRGPLSRQTIIASGGTAPEIYGDPAALLPLLYRPDVPKTHRIGVIPHVMHEAMFRRALAASGADHIKIISLLAVSLEDIERVVRDILSCDEIVSTSLHGVIVSHAYGVPCQSLRVQEPDLPEADSFKMRDYKLSVGLVDSPLTVQSKFTDLKWLDRRKCVLPPKKIDTDALAKAFPFPRSKFAIL